MDIILKTDIVGLGYKNDMIAVKPGYARNYLIPQGFAQMASESNRKILAENLKQAAHKAEKIKTAALTMAEEIGGMVITIAMKTGESGKIFGRVTNTQISDYLKEKGFDIDRKKIVMEDVKFVGDFSAMLDLHKEVKHKVAVSVISEA